MNKTQSIQAKQASSAIIMVIIAATALAFPELALAQDATGAQGRVTSFFTNINSLLNVASIAIVTIAVIFAGYQIAFNHKRVGDVAPVLIGGFLIGAAAQIAKMLLPSDVTSTAMVVGQMLTQYV
ncbi:MULTISPECIES: TrbC/VirB2 family protein [unclassified Pseudoxanthomonas]|uniref:TrbC/VirB2 family protein n=1 Tax=unclassified Pseudoxanthomonas TaxID=2645906 RepID=UPI0008E7D5D2|nr:MULTISPECIES: TrbC/VirB2 family protein [unclassified Pseudoxanthomonas]PPJ41513.1 type VI secretion protein [Pseudoxanthomonas sp. KAs_5_3]SFV30083.1 type IV secretion system protein VirB2 [Pseudoxanthomonas sp. YR558]